MIGEHGREILAEFGISEDEIAALEAAGDITVQTADRPRARAGMTEPGQSRALAWRHGVVTVASARRP